MDCLEDHPTCRVALKDTLKHKPPVIETVIGIYRDPRLKPYVDFLKERVVTERQLPALIMALDMKPSDKTIMLTMMPGFLYAIHHPDEDYGTWDLQIHRSNYHTHHIAQAIREGKIGYTEAMKLLEDIYEEMPVDSNDSKYNNISGRYWTIIKKALR